MPTTKPQSFFRYFPVSDRDMKWGFHVTTVGESRIPPHTPYPLGEHPKGYAFNWANGRTLHDFAIVYLSSGRGWFESKHSPRQRVESGHVFMLFPGVWHRYMPVQKTGWNEHWVGFDGDIPRRLVKKGSSRRNSQSSKLTVSPFLSACSQISWRPPRITRLRFSR